jgi:subtilisin-like proprotein convertase family protein
MPRKKFLKNQSTPSSLRKNQPLQKWSQSASIRFAIAIAFLTGLLVIVSGTGAQNLLSIRNDSKTELLKTPNKSKPKPKRLPNFDVRLSGQENIDRILQKSSFVTSNEAIRQTVVNNKSEIDESFANLKADHSRAEMEGSFLTGAAEVLRSPDGLTKPAPGRTGEEIVRQFISENKGIYGLSDGVINNLNFIGESISPASGLRMVRVEQMINGRPVFQSETRFILDREGRIMTSLGLIIPNADQNPGSLDNLLAPEDALQRTMSQLNVSLDTQKMEIIKSEDGGRQSEIRTNDSQIKGKVTSKLVYFAAAPGVLIPAWSQIVYGVNEDWYVLVDARDGAMLWRKNIRDDASTQDARFRVYVQADGTTPADSPAPQSPSSAVSGNGTQFPEIAPTIVSMFLAQNITASQNGWIDDCPGGVCTANETQTLGNNVLACLDRDGTGDNLCDTSANSLLDGNGRPTGNPDTALRNRDFLGTTPRDFQTNYLPPPQASNPEAGQTPTGNGVPQTIFRRGSVTQQFYSANWYHDKLYALGFDTAAGNFQNNIFGGGGIGNDRVLLDVQDGNSTNNANFSTPPDGSNGRAQMFRFTGPTIDRDGGIDAEILLHELTHGTSNRLIGNGTGLQWDIGGGMGEGWSDYYALSLLNNTNADNPNGNYASGAYATYKIPSGTFLDNYVYGIRRFPYSTNNTINPLTWADVDQSTNNMSGGIPVSSAVNFNANGALEVHNVGEIWANTLWEVRSRIIAANGGDVPTGNQIALQIVTDAMKMTPANPSFIQARDALVNADCTTNACANEQSIWDGFADRGLGYRALAPLGVMFGYTSGHIGLRESFQAPNLDTNTIAVSDGIGNNSGFIDPNEPVRILVNIKNPWRNAGKTATGVTASITSTTPGVVIISGSTTYPNIAPNSNADKLAGGNNLVIKAPPTSPCGTNLYFTLTITSSLGTVMRDFSIRMGQPSGTLAPVTYTQSGLTLAIPDGAPAGVQTSMNITDDYEITDVNLRIDSLTHTFVGDLTFMVKGPTGYGADFFGVLGGLIDGGSGDNLVNTVVDDEAVNDQLTEVAASAPFTKSYLPTMNAPSWVAAGFPTGPDAIPQLSRFDGTSTLGTWTAVISDQFTQDTGQLQSWSLIVTPRNFVCTGFTPVAAHVPVAGTVIDADGRAIPRVIVSLTDSTGTTRTARTNTFGRFQFDDVAVGQTYTLNASAKGYSFVPQVVSIDDEIADLNLQAQ